LQQLAIAPYRSIVFGVAVNCGYTPASLADGRYLQKGHGGLLFLMKAGF
jgi:hypothetical protein